MGLIFGNTARAAGPSPVDDYWYQPFGLTSDAGLAVDAHTVLNCGTVLAAVRFKAQSFGLCPPKVYIEKPGNVREEDRLHYLFRLLRRPNKWQTGFQWRQHQAFNLIIWGNSYNRIIGGDRAFAQELWPLEPSRTRPIDQLGDGSLVYEYRSPRPGVATERLSQSEVLHFRDLSANGYAGLVTYQLLRNIVGIALSAEKHASQFLKQGARVAGFLTPKGTLGSDARERAEKSLRTGWGGPDNEGKIAVLGQEFDFKVAQIDHQKSQFLELRDHQVEEIIRALGIPGVVIGYSKNLMGYASADAFFEKGGIKHSLLPLVENFQDEIDYALLADVDPHYVKFSLATLLRANTKDEYDTLLKAAGRPLLSGNEARRILDLNPDADPSMDKVMMPMNMATGEQTPPPPPPPPEPPPMPPAKPGPTDAEDEALARRFALDIAETLVRREIAAICGTKDTRGAAARLASDADGWEAWLQSWYRRHAQLVSKKLGLSEHGARRYCDDQRYELAQSGVKVAETWERDRAPVLAEMALAEAKGGIPYTAPPRSFTTVNISAPVSVANHPQAVRLPELLAPVVNAPVTVNVPEQKAPVTTINVEPAAVTVLPAVVNARLRVPKEAIKVESHTSVKNQVKAEMPETQKMEIVSMPPVKIAAVPTCLTTVERRDKQGRIEKTRQEQEGS